MSLIRISSCLRAGGRDHRRPGSAPDPQPLRRAIPAKQLPAQYRCKLRRSAPAADNATILRELAAMKQRIAELEAQLNAQKSAADTATGLRTATQQLLPAPSSTSQPAPSSLIATAPATIATAGVPEAVPAVDTMTPFADAWWGWLNGNPRTKDCPLCTKYFTPEIRVDTNYNLDFNHPADDTIGGSSERSSAPRKSSWNS